MALSLSGGKERVGLPLCATMGLGRIIGHLLLDDCVQRSSAVCFPENDPSVFQEAYSVARQFNLIPPICEQAEYHMFQREKVEVQLPELFHKIGKCLQYGSRHNGQQHELQIGNLPVRISRLP